MAGAGYPPLLLTRLLPYGYCVGVASSRAIEGKSYEDVAFRDLAADLRSDHGTIANFRKQYLDELPAELARRESRLKKIRQAKAWAAGWKFGLTTDARQTEDGGR